jgi:hypothetical protein
MKLASLNYTTVSVNNTVLQNNSNSITNFLITIFLFHSNSEQSFQLKINAKIKIKQVIEQIKHKYAFTESKYCTLTRQTKQISILNVSCQ